MRIATWNINGINPRLDHISHWLTTVQPDVVCLQEVKCTADAFPADALNDLGYESAVHADGRWNGVAILSRLGLDGVKVDLIDQPDFDGVVEPRAIAATVQGIRFWSLYVPNGREVDHPHYAYKLDWLDHAVSTVGAEAAGGFDDLFVLGDFNVAPTDADVWDIGRFEGATHVTEAERQRLAALEGAGLVEVYPRALKYEVPFTFWDYRQLAFPKNSGMRIDLVYGTASAVARVQDSYVDRNARKGKGTSDHAPIVVDLIPAEA